MDEGKLHASGPRRVAATARVITLLVCGVAGCNPHEAGVTAKQPVPEMAPVHAPAPMPARKPFWIPGEAMRWKVTARGLHFMDVSLAVGRPGSIKGEPIIIVRSRYDAAGLATTVGVEATKEAITWIRLRDGMPTARTDLERFDWKARGKRGSQSRETRYERGVAWVTRTRNDGSKRGPHKRSLPETGVFDTHGVLGMLRAWDAPDGTYAYFDVFERRLRKHIVRLTRNEMFDMPGGVRPVVRIDGRIVSMHSNFGRGGGKGSRYVVWISNDRDRIPVRIQIPTRRGTVTLDLVDHRRP